ncbi:hypothetical protein COCON_G00132660 [Conger conger]|uniref:Uncharacterized protein n=1 Tax=Conger conger TaxID=82655 RepID=A0A9Q1DE47_CONCO|nr:hypothetical protein COCON_G00132660 [Conger conger]
MLDPGQSTSDSEVYPQDKQKMRSTLGVNMVQTSCGSCPCRLKPIVQQRLCAPEEAKHLVACMCLSGP